MGFLVMLNVDKLSSYGSLTIDLELFAHIFPKMACFWLLFWAPKLFTPTGQFVYTDISVISVTFCNSGQHSTVNAAITYAMEQKQKWKNGTTKQILILEGIQISTCPCFLFREGQLQFLSWVTMSQPGTNPAPGGSNTGGRNHNIITFGQQDI